MPQRQDKPEEGQQVHGRRHGLLGPEEPGREDDHQDVVHVSQHDGARQAVEKDLAKGIRAFRSRALHTRAKPPPPIPEDCGSTTLSANAAATAASAAFPPCRRTWTATSLASGCAVATAPRWPTATVDSATARHVPNAKVICVFRNPAERVVSLYKLKRAYGLIPWTFEQAITRDPEMLESSKYATRLKQWQSALGQDQVMATFYNDLVERPQEYLNDVVDFIGIPRIQLSQSQQLRIHASETMTHPRSFDRTRRASTVADWFKARRLDRLVAAVRNSPLRRLFLGGGPPFADIPQEIVSWLYQLFRAEVEELETMLNRDLSMWKEA